MQKIKKTIIYFIFVCAVISLFTTCKKYPEGGWSNMAIKHLFWGRKNESSKTWHLKKYEVNGIDSTMFITPGNGYTSFENDDVIFTKGSGSTGSTGSTESNVYSYSIAYTEGLKNPKIKESISFIGGSKNPNYLVQCYNTFCERSVFNPSIVKPYVMWDIFKLTENELELRAFNKDNNYKIILTN